LTTTINTNQLIYKRQAPNNKNIVK